MNRPRADIVIMGGGITGCAAAHACAGAGMDTVLVEKGRIAGEQSSRNLGFARQQGRDPFELPLMRACIPLWQGLEPELGADLGWRQRGNTALAGSETTLARFAAWLPEAEAAGIDSRVLSVTKAAALLPGFEGRIHGALYTPSDGSGRARLCPGRRRCPPGRCRAGTAPSPERTDPPDEAARLRQGVPLRAR